MPLGGSIPLPTASFGTVAKQPKAAVRKTANRRCESGPCLLQPRGVMKRGTLLRFKSGFDSRRGFYIWARGETGSRDARIVQSRGRHPAGPPFEGYPQTWYVPSWRTQLFAGVSPAVCPRGEIGHHGSFLKSSSGFESRRGRGQLRYEAARPKRRGAGLSIQSKRVRVPSRPPDPMRGP